MVHTCLEMVNYFYKIFQRLLIKVNLSVDIDMLEFTSGSFESQFIDLLKTLEDSDLIPSSITRIKWAGARSDICLNGLFVISFH